MDHDGLLGGFQFHYLPGRNERCKGFFLAGGDASCIRLFFK